MRLVFQGMSTPILTAVLGLVMLFGASNTANGQDGKALFETNCKVCHHPDKTVTGPPLRNVREKWESEASLDLLYIWVNNYKQAAGMDPYAANLVNLKPDNMQLFNLSDEEITAIFEYVDSYVEPTGGAGGGDMAATTMGEEEEGISYWWYIVGVLLIVVGLAAASVKRQLTQIQLEKDGEEVPSDQSYLDIFQAWAKRNQGAAAIIGLVVLFSLLSVSYGWLKGVNVMEGYHPSQPVQGFSHKIHAGINKIDCQYCHNSASKSKHAGIPTVNVCMNCHKGIAGASEEGKQGVAYIHNAAGFDSDNGEYSGETSPIVWNKVHNLPDHAYFNHSQHVKVGGLECQNCHGTVEEMETVYVAPASELKPVNDDAELQLTRPTLTMGWCIQCHNNVGIGLQGNGAYYEEIHRRLTKRPDIYKKFGDDEKITVRELGGWECAKCHY